ncbi:MAG TPA: hypothetical protein VME46_16380 [Acidimicrobiales bacterium]|nr:hypothetical protein [Acidimicrobiales bacterium]
MSAVSMGSAFAVSGAASLLASWALVARLERLGSRFGMPDALLGVVAACAADSPELTSAIAALARHQVTVGAGVVLGSNLFNLAALLGLSTLIAGRIALHRRVVLLSGAVAVWVAAVSLLVLLGWLPAGGGLLLVGAALAPYILVLGLPRARRRRLPLPRRWAHWLALAVSEEERELAEPHLSEAPVLRDLGVATGALLVVVAASVLMERAVTELGRQYKVPDLVIGALVLAAVTSLPNAVTAGYLAVRGRGAAVLSTALNSNAINVAAGWLLPVTVAGVAVASTGDALMGYFYLGVTGLSLVWAFARRGLNRPAALLIIGAYLAFTGSVLATAGLPPLWLAIALSMSWAAPCVWAVASSARERTGVISQSSR